ncbi:Protein ESSENTIAL FOR POTEXVIRUS ACCUMULATION 1 [Cardamine amara subsp. amara]|uniref:Protein ESSENTIAL FOR POTEXVIRUS ACCUMULATION 1 n=1 Tax=Cardamine amara subsp. amara TaxID=228776 RepID=A0ABD1BL45_CARAN
MREGTVLGDQIDDTHKRDAQSEYERTISADYMNSLYSEKPILSPGYHATHNVEEEYVIRPNNESPTHVTAPETCENKLLEEQAKDVYAGQEEVSIELSVETPATEAKNNELPGGRKTSEKKSRKQRAKQAADLVKTISKAPLQEAKQPETESADDFVSERRTKKSADTFIDNDTHLVKSSTATASNTSLMSSEADPVRAEETSLQNTRTQPGRAWKPAPGFKPKSLLEIQMEEQRVAQAEALAPKISPTVSSVGPWAGIVTNSDLNILRETHGESVISQTGVVKPESVPALKGKKSHLHDLLGDDVLAKSNDKEREVMEIISNNDTLTHASVTNAESFDDDNFIEAKETKKSRKKSARAKNSGAKTAAHVPTVDTSLPTNSVEKGKSSRVVQQQEKDVLPAIPSGPSLGDFVLWKGETANNAPAAAAWSTAPKKSTKPSSLRDIVREQEKLTTSSHPPPNQVPTIQKSTPPQSSQGGVSSWSRSGSSPSQAVSQSALQSKSKGDDDLFWGPVEQSTQEPKQGDFPHLASQTSWGTKNTTGKGNAGSSLNRQKSISTGSADRVSSSPVVTQASQKGKKEAVTKLTEANGFRDWCRSECLRLLGSEDTSVLEFCLKQSRSEAESLLKENLGSRDPDHKFIDKFLNYKDLLPSEVVEIAFQSKGSGVGTRNNTGEDYYNAAATTANDGFSKVGGKKKAKKGKKVSLSASVLGFNVVSNRIMMGEIQTIED